MKNSEKKAKLEEIEWSEPSGCDWCELLIKRPQLAEHCDWSKLDGDNWRYLLRNQPQLAEYKTN